MDGVKILYLVHDLSDAAVKRRTLMLLAGGALVTLMGFRRTTQPVQEVAGCRAVDLGQTYNAGFLRRIISVIREVLLLRRHRKLFEQADIIMARNLEMLAIAVRGRSLCSHPPRLVYECLDIHRLLLGSGFLSAVMRKFERRCLKHACALITSSPAFITHYFEARQQLKLPIRLVENKVLLTKDIRQVPPAPRMPGPPWRIGWFGAIRCRKSLTLLMELVLKNPGVIEVVIRGKVSEDQLVDFAAQVEQTPGIIFLGPYENPRELASIYADVHFTWAIDMFEEGLNSSWLLPNRLYEGGLCGSVPLAIESVETGRFLKQLGIGVVLSEPLSSSLDGFFHTLDAARYNALEDAANPIPKETWLYGPEDCRAFVHYLYSLTEVAHG